MVRSIAIGNSMEFDAQDMAFDMGMSEVCRWVASGGGVESRIPRQTRTIQRHCQRTANTRGGYCHGSDLQFMVRR